MGSIVFFLVSVHLGVGMLWSLIPISQEELGERFFRFNTTICLALLSTAQFVLYFFGSADTPGGTDKVAVWQLKVLEANPWVWASTLIALIYLLSLPFRKYLFSRLLLIASSIAGFSSLLALSSGLASRAIPEAIGPIVFRFDAMLCALVLGSVVICMILGHWYIVDPGMSVRHLRFVAAIFIGGVSARALLGGLISVLVWNDLEETGIDLSSNFVLVYLPFVAQRILFGLVLPLALSWMIWQTVKIRSTQSATGILYVAVVFILFGEFLSRYILVSTGYPL